MCLRVGGVYNKALPVWLALVSALGSKQAPPSIGVASLSLVAVPWLPAMCQQGISREPPGSGAYSNNVCSKQQTTARSASLVIKGFLQIKINKYAFPFVSGESCVF